MSKAEKSIKNNFKQVKEKEYLKRDTR